MGRLIAVSLILVLLGTPGCASEQGEGDGIPLGKKADIPLADSMEHWYALGMGAHHLCAGLWVVGRDHRRPPKNVLEQDIAPFAPFHWREAYEFEVDSAAHEVTVSAPAVGARTAEYNGDQGCTLLPTGTEDVYFTPREVPSTLPAADAQDWPTGTRNARGTFEEVDRAALDSVMAWAFDDERLEPDQNTRGLVVVYRGKIIAERYADGWGPQTPQISWSMGKSIAAALTGVMVERGHYDLEDPAPIDEWQGADDPRREIQVQDLLRMSSGLGFDNFGLDPEQSFRASNEHMRIYFDALNVGLHAINQPLRFEPGTTWRYRNSDPLSLMLIARRTVERQGKSWLRFPQRALFDRIGMRHMVLETDPWGNFIVTGYDFGSTRDWARFGLLHLKDGMWEGERILPDGWVDFIRTPAPGAPNEEYGGLFWLNRNQALSRVPTDAYFAAGYMGQRTLIVPSRDLVVARHGPSAGEFRPYFNRLVGGVLEALGQPVTPNGK